MDYGALPPEINSARMYTGAGSETMLAAAAAWDNLAAELRSTATSQASVISGLTTAWRGPSSANMAAAAAPYTTWLTTTAAQAEHTANQARTAASAYETAFAATVPPPVIAANRAELASLVSTNIVGQNTAAIAANETHYANMWAQDSITMYRYAGQSAAATQVTPFNPPPHTTNPAATAAQSAAATQATGTSAGSNAQSILTQLTSATPNALQSLAAPTATDPLTGLTTFLSGLSGSPLETIAANLEIVPQAILPANSTLINTIMGIAIGTRARDFAEAAGGAAGLGFGGAVSGSAGMAAAGPVVSAQVGLAERLGGLAVPQGWTAATPAFRTITAVLSGAADGVVPAVTMSQESLFTGVAAAAMAGSAVGGAVPRATGTGVRGRSAVGKDRKDVKAGDAPQNLQTLAAAMTDRPESVQHWHTDAENLDSLLAELRQKPGTHAVHVQSGKPKMTPPRTQSI
ncbi:PPE family protein [Mycobacterium sp.]|uniref:PPE family protein n=1 Tax=Mycobacterium sp. TaxID=1785 RepID=UPI0031D0EE93